MGSVNEGGCGMRVETSESLLSFELPTSGFSFELSPFNFELAEAKAFLKETMRERGNVRCLNV